MHDGQVNELSRAETVKLLFSSRHRIDILAILGHYSIDPPEIFSAHEIKETLRQEKGINPTSIHQQLGALERSGLIQRQLDEKYVTNYVRIEAPFWDIAKVAVEATQLAFPEENTN
jgi:Fe2+ or Zn2+ uptake regulation protein